MRERPILFSGPMARAILAGDKTQTRRVNGLEYFSRPENDPAGWWCARVADGQAFMVYKQSPHERIVACPYGRAGDLIWVREPWRCSADLDKHNGSEIADLCLDAGYNAPWAPIQYEADGARVSWQHTSTPPHDGPPRPGRYRHARFMPRWACRLELEITRVRVERLQAINHADAIAEGVGLNPSAADVTMTSPEGDPLPRVMFRALWEQINGSEAWAANPWVWVVEFRRVAGGGQ